MRILFQLLSVIQREEGEARRRASVSDETRGGEGGNEVIQLERRGLGRGSLRRSELDTTDKSASWPLMGFLFPS